MRSNSNVLELDQMIDATHIVTSTILHICQFVAAVTQGTPETTL